MPKGGSAAAGAKKAAKMASSTKERKAADPFEHHSSMTADEFIAVKQYQGHLYHQINAQHRGTLIEAYNDDELATLMPAIQKHSADLDALIGRQSLREATTLYRGIEEFEGFKPSLLRAGDVISDKAFMSTSLKKSTAAGFTSNYGTGEGIVLTIRAPAGTKALPVYKVATGSSFQQSEKEVLLGRGSGVKITKIRKGKDGVYHAQGELIQ